MKMWLLGDVSGHVDSIIIRYKDRDLVCYNGKGLPCLSSAEKRL